MVPCRVSAHVMLDLVLVRVAWMTGYGDFVAAVEPQGLNGGVFAGLDVRTEVVVDKIPSGKDIAAADIVVSRNGTGDLKLVRIGFAVECGCMVVGFAAGDAADRDTVRVVDSGIAGQGQFFDSAAVQLQIAPGKLQLVLVVLAAYIVDAGVGESAASGDGAGTVNLHGKVGLGAAGTLGSGNTALQFQTAPHLQSALMNIVGQAVDEGLHPYLGALEYLQSCVLGNDQLRGGKADFAKDFCAGCDPGCFIGGIRLLRLRKAALVAQIILGDVVVGFHRGFRF